MRHLSAVALAIGLGALCTWFTATSLEHYQLSQHATSQQVEQAQYIPPQQVAHRGML